MPHIVSSFMEEKASQFWQQDIGAVEGIVVQRARFQVCTHVNERGHSWGPATLRAKQSTAEQADGGSQMSDNVRENNNLFEVQLPQEHL